MKNIFKKTKKQNLESVCKYFHDCNVKLTGRDCSHPAYTNCQTFKFYERWGTEPLGIGAMVYVSDKNENEK